MPEFASLEREFFKPANTATNNNVEKALFGLIVP